MADNEQELLRDSEIIPILNNLRPKGLDHIRSLSKYFKADVKALLKAQIAKLKAIGYVKWDRGKVEEILIKIRNDALKANVFRQPLPDYHLLADQLKEILTKG